MHAKKTRDRKKFYLEMSDKIISEMEAESKSLRQYLREIGMISEEDYQQRTLKDLKAKQEIDNMKVRRKNEVVLLNVYGFFLLSILAYFDGR